MKRFAFVPLGYALLALALVAGCGQASALSTPPAQPRASIGATTPPAATAGPAPIPTVRSVEPAAGTGLTPVRIQVSGTIAEAPLYVAAERGYFASEGISPQFITFDSATRAIPALATGQIDVGAGALSAGLFNAINQGIDIRVVAPQSINSTCAHSSTWILVRKDLTDSGAIRSPADLRGRKIAMTSKSGTSEYLADAVLRRGDLQPSDAQYVEMGFGDMGAAFASRAIDVAMGAEPTATSYVDKGLATKWLCGADIFPNMQYTYLLYSPQFADQHTALAQRWMKAYLRGARDWQTMLDTGKDRQALFAILGKYAAIKDPAVLEHISLPVVSPEAQIDRQNVQDQIRWAHQRGYIAREPSPATLVDSRFIDGARDR